MAATERRNAYAVLGLHKGATADEIKMAWVQAVKKYDPEKHTERFMVIQSAFDRLKDPAKRAKEDIRSFNYIHQEFNFTDQERQEVEEERVENAINVLTEKRVSEPQNESQIVPRLIQAYFMRSYRNLHKRLNKEAIQDWQSILAIDPTQQRAKINIFIAQCQMGYGYAVHGLYDECIEAWEQAAAGNPDNHLLIHNLAIASEFAGRKREAMRYWDETLRRWKALYERNPQDEYLKICMIEGHRHQSELAAEAGVQPGSAPAPMAQRAPTPNGPRPAAGAPSPSAPAPHAQSSQSSRPPVKRADQAGGDGGEETHRFREILRLNPEDFDASTRLGEVLIEQKRWPEAIEHWTELARKYPRNIEVIIHLGFAQLNGQDVDSAFRTWARGQKLDPKNFQLREAIIKARMSIGKALRDKGLFVNALVHFKALAAMLPQDEEIRYEMGRTYHLKGDLRSAFGEYNEVLRINPRHKNARTALSEIKIRRG